MKRYLILLTLTCILLFGSACSQSNTTELKIATTIYPIHYLVNELFPNENTISIYPDGADIKNYTLTEKRIEDYSANDLFIYNGLSNELNIAKDLINANKNLKVIDVSYGLKLNYGLEELWLSPNYYLMLATNIKNNLKNLSDNKYFVEEIEKNYKVLEENLSIMDANLREIAKDSFNLNRNTIVASSSLFKYLQNYGFQVIALDDDTINLNEIKENFKNGIYTTLFMKSSEEKTDLIRNLEQEYKAKVVSVNTMETITKEEKENNDTYFHIMENYFENIRKATLGE
ncbi:MAG: zinc ABC transporter substrate-binding protein [Bacilli bacterium]|nr:zinc ABC transporter substrate-binding protein [Bacilli bacterium]